MTTPSLESPTTDRATLRDKAADLLNRAAHVSHEARLFQTVVAGAVEEGVYAAKRTMKKARQQALAARDEMAFRVKREPFKALAVALGVGAALGLAFGWVCRRATRRAD